MNQEQDKKNSQKVTPPSQQQSNSIAIVLYFEIPGVAAVTGDVGLEILKNLSREEPPFKPELGLGGCTWILTAGHPYTGITQNKNVIIPTKVEYADDLEILIFQEEDLQRIFNDKRQILEQTALQDYANFHDLPINQLNRRQKRNALYRAKAAAEKKMWQEVGRRVSTSPQKVGRVELRDSIFSKQGDGDFLLVADRNMIQIIGGSQSVRKAIQDSQETE
jgi:hypothetical protein